MLFFRCFQVHGDTVTQPPTPANSHAERNEPTCPKCQSPRQAQDLECASCGIIFAKWQARQGTVAASAPITRKRKSSGTAAAIAAVFAVLAGVGAWWLIAGSKLAPNEALVTYASGESCKWVDWSFRVRRQVSNNIAKGAVLIVRPGEPEVADDTTLRVYSASGEKLVIAREELREFQFTTMPDEFNSSNNQVVSLTVKTATDTLRFMPQELPRFSRSRVLVPVASHYFLEQSDDYMRWGNVRSTFAGTPSPDCTIDREISLTRTGHSKKRTPLSIRFAGS